MIGDTLSSTQRGRDYDAIDIRGTVERCVVTTRGRTRLRRQEVMCWQEVLPGEGPSGAFNRGCNLFRAFGAVPHPEVNV